MAAIHDTIQSSKRVIERFRSSGDFDYYSQKTDASAFDYGGGGEGESSFESDLPDISEIPDTSSFGQSISWVFIILLLLSIVAIIVYLLYKKGVFDKKPTNEEEEEENEAENVDLNINGIDFEDEISKAKANRNWSEGLRHIYLKALNTLDERNIVVWNREKTPTEYAYEASQTQFSILTAMFLKVRYGLYDTTEEDFLKAENLLKEILEDTSKDKATDKATEDGITEQMAETQAEPAENADTQQQKGGGL